jgi:hypothetical protein
MVANYQYNEEVTPMTNLQSETEHDVEGITIHPSISLEEMVSRHMEIVEMIHATGRADMTQLLLPIFNTYMSDVSTNLDTAATRLPYLLGLLLMRLTDKGVVDHVGSGPVQDLHKAVVQCLLLPELAHHAEYFQPIS